MNKYIKKIKPYSLTSHKAWEYAYKEDVLKLDWNEASTPPTPLVRERVKRLIEIGMFNWYPDVKRDEVLDLLQNYVGVKRENLQYFASSDSLHEYIATMLLTVGKSVLVLGPTYDNFRLTCESMGADVVFFQYDSDFSFNLNAFRQEILDKKPSLVYICNPNNPTGFLHSVETIEALLKEFPLTYFLVDEAYYEFDKVTCKDLVMDYNNLLVTRTFSKAFAIANFRIGYLMSSTENIAVINKIRNPKNISSFSQEAAIAVLSDIDYMEKYVRQVNESKAFFARELELLLKDKAKIYAIAGNFVFIDFAESKYKNNFIESLEENRIFVRNLSFDYKKGNYVRVTIGTQEQMGRVLRVIEEQYV
ncbi:histidinol-phosphate transaminase [Tenacibaculum soleae]|uniref:pyridoxal phosphate-dependent aminotransferase n=1 Tax=Tenacibaculum soleae TaxID=447689 RepID=UPI0026E2337A|nr:histidinol-phosphate transaminase [Tenacibaculum soleae]MDO6743438.1 histidinol-phosphate transaminase [Tenacibaculum soleae]